MATRGGQGQRNARARGESAEAQVAAIGRLYEARGKARVWKRPTPTRQVGRVGADGLHRAFYAAGAGCDFHALLAPRGRMAVLEVKSTGRASMPLRARDGGPIITPVQAAELTAASALGGLALLLLRVRLQWWVMLWPRWVELVEEVRSDGRGSATVDVLDRHGARCAPGPGGPDWLANLPPKLLLGEEVSRG